MNQLVPVPRRMPAPLPPQRALRARQIPARRRKQTNMRLWLPVTPIAVALSPLAVLVVPLVAMADVARRTHTAAMLVNGARLLLSMSGTEVTVQSRKANIHIKIF